MKYIEQKARDGVINLSNVSEQQMIQWYDEADCAGKDFLGGEIMDRFAPANTGENKWLTT